MRPRKDIMEINDDANIQYGFNYTVPDLTKLENTDPNRYYYHATPDMIEGLKLIGYEVDERCPSKLPGHITMSCPLALRKQRELHELKLSRARAGAAMAPNEPGFTPRGEHQISERGNNEPNEQC